MAEREEAGRRDTVGARPPWWPAGEPVPTGPDDHAPGDDRTGRFARRLSLAVALVIGLVFVLNLVAFGWLTGGPPDRPRGPWIPFPLLGIALLVIAYLAGRTVRRMAEPVADVMAAADRVAAGDYGARVRPGGSVEVRRLGHAFNQMAARLQANEAQRRRLLADVTHELRTPLSVIRGNVEGILDGVYPADEAHLRPVLEETTVMARLLDDLHTLSTAQAGVLRLERELVDPVALVQDAAGVFGPRAVEAGLTLEWRAAAGLPELDVDPVRIGQVLTNLLSNAVRHTPPGGLVRVEVEPVPGGVRFSVTDTGPGISDADLERVFDRFVKSADSGGAGLGLAIARSLVEAHGGRITAQSAPGRGTAMRFVLPGAG